MADASSTDSARDTWRVTKAPAGASQEPVQ